MKHNFFALLVFIPIMAVAESPLIDPAEFTAAGATCNNSASAIHAYLPQTDPA